jgi:hypothetical protein
VGPEPIKLSIPSIPRIVAHIAEWDLGLDYAMQSLCLILGPQLQVELVERRLGKADKVGVHQLTERKTGEELVFYDWIADRNGALMGLEIHLGPDHPSLKTLVALEQLPYVETDGFVRIWLSDAPEWWPLGKEAFGDIRFFEDRRGVLVIVVGIDDWLSEDERGELLRRIRARLGE